MSRPSLPPSTSDQSVPSIVVAYGTGERQLSLLPYSSIVTVIAILTLQTVTSTRSVPNPARITNDEDNIGIIGAKIILSTVGVPRTPFMAADLGSTTSDEATPIFFAFGVLRAPFFPFLVTDPRSTTPDEAKSIFSDFGALQSAIVNIERKTCYSKASQFTQHHLFGFGKISTSIAGATEFKIGYLSLPKNPKHQMFNLLIFSSITLKLARISTIWGKLRFLGKKLSIPSNKISRGLLKHLLVAKAFAVSVVKRLLVSVAKVVAVSVVKRVSAFSGLLKQLLVAKQLLSLFLSYFMIMIYVSVVVVANRFMVMDACNVVFSIAKQKQEIESIVVLQHVGQWDQNGIYINFEGCALLIPNNCNHSHFPNRPTFFSTRSAITSSYPLYNEVGEVEKNASNIDKTGTEDIADYIDYVNLMSKNIIEDANETNFEKEEESDINEESMICNKNEEEINNRNIANAITTKLTSKYEEILNDNYISSLSLTVHPPTHTLYEVCDDGERAIVDLTWITCSCNRFQMDQIPCKHAITVLKANNEDPY
ncbi:hypothetical protein F8388_021086 [Cannabis sativa]|uniref:SWIM-type domain-containing protein n=1 Tax=Cannabis sativa TaxID=3483 RepID=A0A7J6GZ79_CANSA|nr:hypothetical protein F8388_021086 [Cannabis sativa]